MNEFMGAIYCWFDSLFGQNLAEHLWGWDAATEAYTKINQFNLIGLITFLVTLLVGIAYYYWPLNHPQFCRWWSWLIMLILNGVINLFIGYGMTYSDLLNGVISDDLLYVRDESGRVVEQLINQSNCWGFGIANFIVSALFFLLVSSMLKWKSTACKHSPI